MKIGSSVALAALACTLSTTTVSAGTLGAMTSANQSATNSPLHQVGGRGRDVAIGVGALVGTAIILSEVARADGHRRYQRTSSCGRLLYRCEDGSEWSCRRYERNC